MRIKIQTGLILLFWLLTVLFLPLGEGIWAFPLPDTGQTMCYDATGNVITCPLSGEAFYGQDAQYNLHPRSYTKLDASGNALPENAATWVMVKDNVTDLIWEMKTDDDSIHDKDNRFTWCDTNPATNGGSPGKCGTGTGNSATDTEAFINALNSANYGGHSDWRMPTAKELATLVNSSIPYPGPTIDAAWFPNTVSSSYWSSTTHAEYTSHAWEVSFVDGGVYCYTFCVEGLTKSGDHYVRAVRAVRAGQSGPLGNLVINGDGTVTDTGTGLMWQKATAPGTYTWEQALAYVATLNSTGFAGYTDWRLPDRNELQSLIDYSRYNPAIDPLLDADTVSSGYSSSTTVAGSNNDAWGVGFYEGNVGSGDKSGGGCVRAVRAGQYGAFGSLYASFINAGIWNYSGAGTDWSQITPSNPQLLVTVGPTLYGTFPDLGIWKFDGTNWTQTTTSVPEIIVGTSSTLYGSFAGLGIWQWNGTQWSQTTPSIPQTIIASTSDLYGTFGNLGIWKFNGTDWNQLTASIPDMLVTSGTKLYGTFANLGIWKYDGTEWKIATSSNPQLIAASSTKLYGSFAGAGIWEWDGAATWTKISEDTPTQMVASGTELYAVFSGVGVKKWDGATWSLISGNEPAGMIVGE